MQIVVTTNTNTAPTNAGDTPTYFSWKLIPTNFQEKKCTDFQTTCINTNNAFAHDTCAANGLQVLIPRSKSHWVSLIDRFGTDPFKQVMAGVYKPRNGESYTFVAMNSGAMPENGYKALDGGEWWIRDTKYSEPSGDYTKGCWLGTWGVENHPFTFNDANGNYKTNLYMCSDNNPDHTRIYLNPPTGTIAVPGAQQSLAGSVIFAASSERVAQAIASTSIAYSLVVKACNAANECSEEFTTTKTCLAPHTFKDHNGLCRGCASGKISLVNDASTCIELCVPGKYLNDGVCQTMTTSTCIAGQGFSSASAYQPGSMYPLKGATANDGVCSSCLPGFFKGGAGAASCQPCALGNYAGPGSGALECVVCPSGTYNDVATGGVGACKKCVAGSSLAATGTTTPDDCLGCYSGQHSAAGASVCIKCPSGRSLKDISRKIDLHDDIADCLICPAFTYNPFPGLGSECFPCLSQKDEGGTSCSGCDPGKWKNDVADTCDLCVAGKYSNDRDVSSCMDCPQGYHALAARPYIQCVACSRGTYGTSIAAIDITACINCLAGRFSDNVGLKIDVLVDGNGDALSAETIALAACKLCPKGRWSTTTGGKKESLCINCGPGTHGSVTGGADNKNSCILCAKGKYSETVGSFGESDTCISCPAGYSIDEFGLTYW